jgi:twinkle protein
MAKKTWEEVGIDIHGRNSGEVATTCPQCSKDRKKKNVKCLSVNVDKEVWNCNHCGWTGSLLQGGERPKLLHWQKPTWRKPAPKPESKVSVQAKAWLNDRGITDGVIDRNKLFTDTVYMPQVEDFVSAIAFPYYRDGELINVKWRDGKKNFRLESGAERVLYGLHDVAKVTIIVEGEIDKLSVEVAGFKNCISVPDGAPAENAKDYGSKFDYLNEPALDAVSMWVLAVDNDGPGKKLEEELARRFGREKCVRVSWPEGCKDANDTLNIFGARMLKSCIDNAQAYPIEGAFSLGELEADLDDLFANGMPKGQSTGWHSLNEFLTLLPGQMTIVTGIPSHGKSEWMDALAVNLCDEGWRFGMYSPENHPLHFHLAKLSEKVMGSRFGNPEDRDAYEQTKEWLREHIWLMAPEQPNLDTILDIAKQMVRRNGINGLVIDPWNEIEHAKPNGLSETEYISICLTKIRLFARKNGVHVFIVAHPTKLQKGTDGTYPVPTPYDISGSSHWRNKADNCITVWRDVNDESRPSQIYIQKVRFRFLGKVGMAELFWQSRSGRYSETPEVRYSMESKCF